MRRGEFPIGALPAWCKLNGINLFNVRVADVRGKGYGLVAREELQNDDSNIDTSTLLTVPKDLVLNSEAVEEYAKEDQNFRALLEAAGHESHRRDILMFLLVQMILSSPDHAQTPGVRTPWTQYFSLLPREVPLPTMWTEAERSQLAGTSLEYSVAAKLREISREFESLRALTEDMPYWNDLLWADDTVVLSDWILLDAMFRSRSLQLPRLGTSMVPCLDMVNHAQEEYTARWEVDQEDQVALLLEANARVSSGSEITISYGQLKPAAEFLFSYGFISEGIRATQMVFPLQATDMDDDPFAKAKLYAFGSAPTLTIDAPPERGSDPKWTAPFIWLSVLNEEDGLQFGVTRQTDGEEDLRVFWQGEDVSDRTRSFETLIADHELQPIFELRAVTLVEDQVQQQLEASEAHGAAPLNLGVIRAETTDAAMLLGNLEYVVLQETLVKLGEQKSRLLQMPCVVSYLGSMEVGPKENDHTGVANDEDDFS